MPCWRSLSNPKTDFVFAQSCDFGVNGAWDWICSTIEREFECSEDDIGSYEDDDGREFLTVNGEPVAELHYCFMHNLSTAEVGRKLQNEAA